MKKALVFVMAAVMSLSMSLTAFASPSPTEGEVHFGDVSCTTSDLGQETVKDAVSAVVVEKGKEVNAVFAKDISLPEGTTMPEGGVDLTISVGAVKAGDRVIVLHFNGTNWENIPVVSVANGEVTAHFTSLSPVVVFVETAKNETNNGNGEAKPSAPSESAKPSTQETPSAPSTQEAPAASPKTGETNTVLMAAAVMVIFAATAVVSGVKVKKTR